MTPSCERQARTAVDRAGALAPYRFSGRGLVERGGSGFSAQRRRLRHDVRLGGRCLRAGPRARPLTSGPFIGRNGPIAETLRLRSADADEATVRLDFAHDPDTDVFMTGTGPVLFASC